MLSVIKSLVLTVILSRIIESLLNCRLVIPSLTVKIVQGIFAWPSAACCTVQWAIHTCYYSSVENVYILHCFQDITVSLFTLLLVMWNHSSAIAVKITAMCGMLLIRKLIIADVWCFLALTYAILSLVNLTMINRKIFVNWAPDFYTSCILTMCFCLYPVAANDGNR